MATLIGDLYGADPSPFHSRAPSSGIAITAHQQQPQSQQQTQHQHQHTHPYQDQDPHNHPPSRSQPRDNPMLTSSTSSAATTTPQHPASPPLSSSNSFSSPPRQAITGIPGHHTLHKDDSAAARIPTPPDSSSPSSPQQTRESCAVHPMAAPTNPVDSSFASSASSSSFSTASADTIIPTPTAARPPPPTNAIPSPATNGDAAYTSASSSLPGLPPSYILPVPPLPQPVPEQRAQRTIMIRDLNHIQSLTQSDSALGGAGLGGGGLGSLGGGLGSAPLQDVKFEISAMPIGDIIEMVAALLTKITTTNDHQHDALHRNASQQRQAQAHNEGATDSSNASGHSPFSASVLAFHGKNVPAITILSYLSRIHKYCPTTYEVFLSLLVYFDRMTERVNDLVMKQQQEQEKEREKTEKTETADVVMRDDNEDTSSGVDETDEGLADSDSSSDDDDDEEDDEIHGGSRVRRSVTVPSSSTPAPSTPLDVGSVSAATYFVVDSYNIHRLIIAGVTCASKFFSDVFYTNARYAKVGGLPLAELNHLELQFLILNDFRLAIPIEDLEAYATMLVEFYAREVVGMRPRPSSAAAGASVPASTSASVTAAP